MTNATHPGSAGLRILADKLDELAAEGCVPKVKADIRLTKQDFARVCQHLDLVSQPVAAARGAYDIFHAKQTIDGLEVEGWNFLGELCEKKTVTRTVEMYVCDAADIEVQL